MKWLQLWLASKKLERFAVFRGKIRKREILKKKRGSWEEWLNIIESFAFKCQTCVEYQLYSRYSANQFISSTVKIKRVEWFLLGSFISFPLHLWTGQWERNLPIWIIWPDKHMADVGSVWYHQSSGCVKLESFANKMERDWNEFMVSTRPRTYTLY